MKFHVSNFCVLCLTLIAAPIVGAQTYYQFENFPDPAIYAVVGTALPDGRLVVWNGDSVYVQPIQGGDFFSEIASGYSGDPAFITLSPDGHTLLLGGGFNGKLYLLDTDAPVDYVADSEVLTLPHYSGAFISSDLILLDRVSDDWSTDELAVVDISGDEPVYRAVMDKPFAGDILPNTAAASAYIAVNSDMTTVYATEYVYNTLTWATEYNQLKSISVKDIIDAYTNSANLDWDVDAEAIGGLTEFGSGGPMAITNDGNLLIGDFWIDGLQVVDPMTETIVDTLSPAGAGSYSVIYNKYADDIVVIANGSTAYASEGEAAHVPALGYLGLLILMGSLAVLARRRFSS